MSSLSNYNTFNISPGKQAYVCSINDFWASRLKFLARIKILLTGKYFSYNLHTCTSIPHIRNFFSSMNTILHNMWAGTSSNLAKYLTRCRINLDESSKCNICDDDIVEDLNNFLFECKTLRGIRRELFEEIETVIKSFYLFLAPWIQFCITCEPELHQIWQNI
jgi:hypothetical protein